MELSFYLEHSLNGLQFGLMLFLLAAGLSLIFGIMDFINLAHGSLYMLGAYLMASLSLRLNSFGLALFLSISITALLAALLEYSLLRHLYRRDHLSQVLASFALILIANEAVRIFWGPQAILLNTPAIFAGSVPILTDFNYSSYRLLIIATGLCVALLLYLLIQHTRIGMWVRAGASLPEMARCMGVNIQLLFTLLFALGAALCALAGALLGPILAVQVGMGEQILILAFVVVVIGGIGSVRGAFIGALLVGALDTLSKTALPLLLKTILANQVASELSAGLSSVLIYLLMAVVLYFKPQGLFPARS